MSEPGRGQISFHYLCICLEGGHGRVQGPFLSRLIRGVIARGVLSRLPFPVGTHLSDSWHDGAEVVTVP